MSIDHIKFATDILKRLGEELIPNPDQGIIELVRNSYDADALECRVKLDKTDDLGGSILISDNGIGMDSDDIRNGWLVLGHSQKSPSKVTDLGRVTVGDKGLGRLAALRLGNKVTLRTRPKSKPGVEYQLTIDWREFDHARLVEDVPLTLIEQKTNKRQGSDILIKGLKLELGRDEIARLARSLILLSNPFEGSTSFRTALVAPGFLDLERRVQEAYFEEADYHLKATLNEQGLASVTLSDFTGRVYAEAAHTEVSRKKVPYQSSPAEFDLWVFLLTPTSFSTRHSSTPLSEVREWLGVVGGVHIYYRGLRVPPYGDREHDWLEINLSRAKSPEERPSTNTIIGKIVLTDPEHLFMQKTDRVGFIENQPFFELRRFAVDALEWMAKVRLKAAEKKRETRRKEASQEVSAAKSNLNAVIQEKVSSKVRPELKKAVQTYERAVKRESETLRADLQLYRSLATAGIITATYAHESPKAVNQIIRLISLIETRAKAILGRRFDATLEEPISLLHQSAQALRRFAKLPLYLLKKEKRQFGFVEIHTFLKDTKDIFEPFLADAKIKLKLETADRKLYVHGSIALLEAVITNFLTNAINIFNMEGARIKDREVVIRTDVSGDWIILRILDNGPGIIGLELDEIWLPGRSTIEGGTGLGLTIARDAVVDLGGKVHAIANGELGGAEFVVTLPLTKTESIVAPPLIETRL